MNPKPLTEIEEAELVLGKRPQTQESDTAACSQCHRTYTPPCRFSFCPKCSAEGHVYRLKSLAEARWWVRFHGWKLEQTQSLVDELAIESGQRLVEAMEKGQ